MSSIVSELGILTDEISGTLLSQHEIKCYVRRNRSSGGKGDHWGLEELVKESK